jgi:hypothetical protein
MFRVAALRTRIDAKGITYRFYPFHFRDHFIPWSDVSSAEVVQYRALRDFGGWGIRWGQMGKAYTTSGEWGLQLILKDGYRVMIGTQRREEMREWIAKVPVVMIFKIYY